MRKLLTFLLLFIGYWASAQKDGTITVTGFRNTYTLTGYKIYEDSFANPAKWIASINGNRILRITPNHSDEVLYTVANEKIYRTADTSKQNLLLYFKGNTIYLKTKKGTFEPAGSFVRKSDSNIRLLGYLEPLEYFAFLIAADEIDN